MQLQSEGGYLMNTATTEWNWNESLVIPLWTIEDGLQLIRRLQPNLKPLGFHVALAGGNLNRGLSFKDLDLVFLPLTNDKAPDIYPLVEFLIKLFDEKGLDHTSHKPNPYTPYRMQLMFPNNGKRIDVFIV
jgi:hypothetical protein